MHGFCCHGFNVHSTKHTSIHARTESYSNSAITSIMLEFYCNRTSANVRHCHHGQFLGLSALYQCVRHHCRLLSFLYHIFFFTFVHNTVQWCLVYLYAYVRAFRAFSLELNVWVCAYASDRTLLNKGRFQPFLKTRSNITNWPVLFVYLFILVFGPPATNF